MFPGSRYLGTTRHQQFRTFICALKTEKESVWECPAVNSVSKLFVEGKRITHTDKIHPVIIVIKPGVGYVGSKYRDAMRSEPISEIKRFTKKNS